MIPLVLEPCYVYPTRSAAFSLCSHSFSIIHPFHPFITLLPEWCFQKKDGHSFTDDHSVAPITCRINIVFLSIPYKVLSGLAALPLLGSLPPPRLSHLDALFSSSLIHLCWNACGLPRLCAFQCLSAAYQCGAISYSSSSAVKALHPDGPTACKTPGPLTTLSVNAVSFGKPLEAPSCKVRDYFLCLLSVLVYFCHCNFHTIQQP